MSTVVIDANGIKTLSPVPSGAGGDLLLDNDAALSALRTADRAVANAAAAAAVVNAAGVAANLVAIGANDTDILALQGAVAANLVAIGANDVDILALQGAVGANDADILSLQNAVNVVSVTNHGTTGDGVADDYAEIVLAEAEAVANGQWLLFPPGTYLINTNIIFRVPVLFGGGILRLASTVTATFNQPYMNPSRQQCFDEQGRTTNQVGGVIVAEGSPQDTVRPEDWGAIPDGITANNHIPIQQAIDAVTYTASSLGKTGRVLFSSGTYLVNDSIFVGYDWINYGSANWATRAKACWRGYDGGGDDTLATAQSRKQNVHLEGVGHSMLKAVAGSLSSTDYLLYYSNGANNKAFYAITNMAVDCVYLCRGVYASFLTCGKTIDGLFIHRSLHVGLDFIECWGGRLLNVFVWYYKGIGVRTWQANSCYMETPIILYGRGNIDSNWPLPTDQTVRAYFMSVMVQTPVWERAAFWYSGDTACVVNPLLESNIMGSAVYVVVDADTVTCTLAEHGLQDGDPIWLFTDSVQTTVAVRNSSSEFTVTDSFVTTGGQVIYRRCSAIDSGTDVFTCQNHNLADGQYVRIQAGAGGMVELNDGGLNSDGWYRVKWLSADAFTLYDAWDDDAVPGGAGWTLLDISGEGFSAADGSEYIISSAAGIYWYSYRGRISNIRLEGNSILRSKIIMPNGSGNSVVDGMSIVDHYAGECDYAVEWRQSVYGSSVLNVYGSAITKYVVYHHDPTNDDDVATSNRIVSNTVYGLDYADIVSQFHSDSVERLNNVEGIITPGVEVANGDTTPQVYESGSTVDFVTYGAVLYIAADHDKDEGGAGAGAITNFTRGVNGQSLKVHFLGAISRISNCGTIATTTGADVDPAAHDELTFRNVEGVWYQV